MKTYYWLFLLPYIFSYSFISPPNKQSFAIKSYKKSDSEKIKKYLFGNVVYYSPLIKTTDKFGDETMEFINFGALGAECKFAPDGSKVIFVNGAGTQLRHKCKITDNKLYLTDEKGNEKIYIVTLETYGIKAIQISGKTDGTVLGKVAGYIFHKNVSINYKQ